jgi:hypothetical protein
MTEPPFREWGLYQNCAFVCRKRFLGHDVGNRTGYDANADDYDAAVKHFGSESAFLEWANDYTENAYGVKG